ncbi:hypothetical protein NN561_017951 [Cricetulus griseus]
MQKMDKTGGINAIGILCKKGNRGLDGAIGWRRRRRLYTFRTCDWAGLRLPTRPRKRGRRCEGDGGRGGSVSMRIGVRCVTTPCPRCPLCDHAGLKHNIPVAVWKLSHSEEPDTAHGARLRPSPPHGTRAQGDVTKRACLRDRKSGTGSQGPHGSQEPEVRDHTIVRDAEVRDAEVRDAEVRDAEVRNRKSGRGSQDAEVRTRKSGRRSRDAEVRVTEEVRDMEVRDAEVRDMEVRTRKSGTRKSGTRKSGRGSQDAEVRTRKSGTWKSGSRKSGTRKSGCGSQGHGSQGHGSQGPGSQDAEVRDCRSQPTPFVLLIWGKRGRQQCVREEHA